MSNEACLEVIGTDEIVVDPKFPQLDGPGIQSHTHPVTPPPPGENSATAILLVKDRSVA
ncbi:MAG TPA: hypothetical protein VER03_17915 [Bryobacteraceae bacterium]|nr:hypothetical protein [Bryobacteraceae bacterium]